MEKVSIKEKTVTVIVPVYNVEKYLDRCINSIVGQTYRNLEIILVDDGSPDGCPEMCDAWRERDSRIKVIHKKNAGLGYARNTGIDNATGEYLCFVDSDDYIAIDAIEKAYNCALQYNADIVSYGYYVVDSNGKVAGKYLPKPYKSFFEGNEVRGYVLPNMIATDPNAGDEFWMSMCGGLFSNELITRAKWRLVSERDVISEDIFSLLRLYKSVNRVAFVQEAFYFYCNNTTSLTHTIREDRYDKIRDFYDMAVKECDNLGYSEEVKRRLVKPYLDNTLAALKMVLQAELQSSQKRKSFNKIVKDELFHKAIKKVDMKKTPMKKRLLWLTIEYKLYGLSYIMIKSRI